MAGAPKTFDLRDVQPAPCDVLAEEEAIGVGLLPNKGPRLERVAPWLARAAEDELKARPDTSVSKARATMWLWCCCFYNCFCCCQSCFGPWCGDKFCFERAVCTKVTLRRDLWIGLAHFACFCIHTFFASWSFAAGAGKRMEIQIFRVQGRWNSTGADGYRYEVVPDYTVRIDYITGYFFALSAFAHLVWVVFGALPVSVPYLWRSLDRCIVPTRWLEYTASASLMMIAIAIISGTRDSNTLFGIFALCATTMLLGLVTEMHSRPEQTGVDDQGQPVYNYDKWGGDPAPVKWADFTVFYAAKKWRSYSWRVAPHLIGWIPYIGAWYLVLGGFLRQIFDLPQELRDRIPGFVIPAITGTFVIFSTFSFIQLRHQWTPPRNYWKTELWYCLLSATAKIYLGGLLLANVLLLGSVEESGI